MLVEGVFVPDRPPIGLFEGKPAVVGVDSAEVVVVAVVVFEEYSNRAGVSRKELFSFPVVVVGKEMGSIVPAKGILNGLLPEIVRVIVGTGIFSNPSVVEISFVVIGAGELVPSMLVARFNCNCFILFRLILLLRCNSGVLKSIGVADNSNVPLDFKYPFGSSNGVDSLDKSDILLGVDRMEDGCLMTSELSVRIRPLGNGLIGLPFKS